MSKAKIITTNIQKGGSGKTTTVGALCSCLSEKGFRVLAIDLDAQANLTFHCGYVEVEQSIYNVLKGECKIKDVILKTESFDIVPADILLTAADMEFNGVVGREMMLKKALKPIMSDYDYIIIDTPPNLGILPWNALTAADYVVIPVEPSYFAISGVTQLYSMMIQIKEYFNPSLEILGVLMVKCQARTILTRQVTNIADEICKEMNTKVFGSKISNCTAIGKAQGDQVAIMNFSGAKALKYKEEYRTFTEELLKEIKEYDK